MALPQGINFRATLGYVTDGANEHREQCVAFSTSYPTLTAEGNNVGFLDAIQEQLNRDSGNDRRLAGIVYTAGGSPRYQITLPSTGQKNIHLAAGDAGGSNSAFVELFDDTSSLGVLVTSHTGLTQDTYYDATDTVRTDAQWVADSTNGGTGVTKTFATTTLIFELGDNSGNDVLAHFYVEDAGGGGGTTKRYSLTTLGVG